MAGTLSSFPLRELVVLLLAGRDGHRWQIRDDEPWCQLTPRDYPTRVQGWKLHVSATWLSAPVVLHQAAQVLLEHGCAFKFAGTLGRVRELTDKGTDRAQAGKFLTAYPRDDDHLRTLAPLLDQATAGLPGPAVLSDRRYREGSLVSYRFGAFAGVPVLNQDGAFEVRLEAPDGTLVADARQPWFCPPEWAPPPYPGPPARPATPATLKPVLLAGRFRVDRAISHSARGGVYRATDQQTGEPVVIKQARAHIAGLAGAGAGDARDGLRHEAAMLAVLAGLGPPEVQQFESGPDRFLAVAELAGQPLTGWVRRWTEQPADPDREGPPLAEARSLAARLADLVDAVHERGLVFRDLAPNNVMVREDGSLRLIDAELAARPGEWVGQAYTPGFAAPELVAGPLVGPAPGPGTDHYSLGALLCYLATGLAPAFAPDSPAPDSPAPAGRSTPERIATLLGYAAARNPAARALAPAVRGLTAEDPARRWDTARLRGFLDRPPPPGPPAAGSRGGRLEPDRLRRMVTDGLGYLAAAVTTAPAERLVASSEYGSRSDPCNLQHGAAGVLAVLVRGSELPGGEPLRAAVARVARWLDRRRSAVSPLLPGLYFGRAGTAWALHSAARQLGDDGMAERALELAAALPVRWPNPDLTHGTAGVGLASLHLWRETKEPTFRDRVEAAVDHLLEQARDPDGQVHWQVAPDFDSKLAGVRYYGFAHGVAGIGAFLLAAGQATGRPDARAMAERAGETLAAATVRVAGGAYWPNDLAGPTAADLRYHWCSGASGVGTFLLRLGQATGQERYRELAHAAAVMVRRGRWSSGVAACHGLAGNGEFLLDLAAATPGGGRYRAWAEEHAACLYVRGTLRDGRLVVPDQPVGGLNLDFNTGYAGVVGFLLRLCHGGPRWWMVDPGPAEPVVA